jgi:TrmH family RNA methyltransferase
MSNHRRMPPTERRLLQKKLENPSGPRHDLLMTGTPIRLGRTSPRLKELRRRARRRRAGEVMVEGWRLVADLVRWGVRLRELYLGESAAISSAAAQLVAASADAWIVADSVLESVAPTRHPQGVLAVVAEPTQEPWQATVGITLYLDQLQDPGNVGAIIRSAAALGAGTVLISKTCADPYHPAAVRGSAAAVFRLPVVTGIDPAEAAGQIRTARGEVWAADTTGVAIDHWRPGEPTLLLLGSEGSGLSDEAAAAADQRVTIPLARSVESLNVAVAAALLLQTWTKSRPA